jgi:polysaccharide biosynthesis/export protein
MFRQRLLFFSLVLCSLSSCISHQELINFRSGKEKVPMLSQSPKQAIANQNDLKLQVNDVLGIIVSSPDVILSTPYNLVSPQMVVQSSTATSPNSFIINNDGNVSLPSLGTFKALGLTIKELQAEVLKKVSVFLQDPSVNIRLLNFKVSVSGEVLHPGTFPIENERITILEALSRAGDLTPYSNREHIMIIREQNGVREYGEINLKDTQFFTSPYYYLQQNDIVYVEPTKAKVAQLQQINNNTYLQPLQIGVSLGISILTLIILNNNK